MACHLLIDSKMCDGEQDDEKEYQEWEGEQQEVREREREPRLQKNNQNDYSVNIPKCSKLDINEFRDVTQVTS